VSDLGSNDLATVDPGTGATTFLATGANPAGLAVAGATIYVALHGASAVAVLGDSAPVVDGVSVSPAQPNTNDLLVATVTAHDVDGDALTYSYQWTRNGADLAGATAATLDLSVAGNGDRGDSIAVRVTASDGSTISAPLTSAAVVVAEYGSSFTPATP